VRHALAVLFVVASAAGAAAQEGRPERAPGRRPPREEIFRMVDAYIAEHLQESLALSDEQLNRLMPLVRKLNADRRRFTERRIRSVFEMRRMLKEPAPNEARIAELLQQLRAAEAEEPAAIRAAHDAIDAQLSPLQQARFRILEAEVEHRVRRVMASVRGQRPNGATRRDEDAPRPPHDPR
jgi:hypothetical protein